MDIYRGAVLLWTIFLWLPSDAARAGPAPPGGASASVGASTGQTGPLPVDRSGKVRKGEASYYSPKSNGKEMANGEALDPASNDAASKVLPLGTTAKVTNLDNNKSQVVVVKDRGPYVEGRIIDVTPKTAEKLGMKKEGVAPVVVKPLHLPPKQESSAPGDGSGK